MTNTYFYLYLFFLHWVGDFVCQTNWMALNKSKYWDILIFHVGVYCFVLALGSFFWVVLYAQRGGSEFIVFVAINFALHFCTDTVTSRISAYWWKQERRDLFFITIGFDQFLHACALLLTSYFILGI